MGPDSWTPEWGGVTSSHREGGPPGEEPYKEEWGGAQCLQACFKSQGWAEQSIWLFPKLTNQILHFTSSGTERGWLEKRSGVCSVRKSLPKGLGGKAFSSTNMESQPISQPPASLSPCWKRCLVSTLSLSIPLLIPPIPLKQSFPTLPSLVSEFSCIFNISVHYSTTFLFPWKLAFPLVTLFI